MEILGKFFQQFLTKLNIILLDEPASNHIPWYLLKTAENLCPNKNLSMDVYSTLIHNCENLEAPCPSVGEWLNKLQYI
jgi:hypothetical protein